MTKILGGDSHSLFPSIKDKNFLSPHICQIDTFRLKWNIRGDAAHVRQLLNCFHASPSEGCTITPSTASCDWCHVMCSAVLGDKNNLCSLGVIGKYLSFLYATRVFPCQLWVCNGNAHMSCTRSAEVRAHVNFLVS